MKKLNSLTMFFPFLSGLCLILLVGCGQAKVPKSNEIKAPPISNESEKGVNRDSVTPTVKNTISNRSPNKSELVRIKVDRSDSTYLIQFFDENGVLTGTYDIWENDPWVLSGFEKIKGGMGIEATNYRIPGLTKNQLKGKVPSEFYSVIHDNIPINKIANVVNISMGGGRVAAICYSLVALEDYPEEDTNQGIFNKIIVVDHTGNLIQTLNISQKAINRRIAITQDSKYLGYPYSTAENNEGCFDIYDLRREKFVFTYCVEKGLVLSLGLDQTGYFIAAATKDYLKKRKRIYFILPSKQDKIYMRYDEPTTQYAGASYMDTYFEYLEDKGGKLEKVRLYYESDFQEIINLNK